MQERRVVIDAVRVAHPADVLDLVGPAGLVLHGEDGAIGDGRLERAHRYAQSAAIQSGTTDIYKNIISEHYLGLPRFRAAPPRHEAAGGSGTPGNGARPAAASAATEES